MSGFDSAAYNAAYQRDNIRRVVVKVNRVTEPAIAAHLETVPNVQRYILDLIRADITEGRQPSDSPNPV